MRLTLALNSVLLVFLPSLSLADAVITADATKFGRIVSFDSDGVSLQSGCDAGESVTVRWSDILLAKLDAVCRPHDVLPNPAGLEKCDQKRVPGFKVQFKNAANPFFALKMALKANGKVYLISMVDETGVSGSREEVESIQPLEVCTKSLPKKQSWPKSYCYETRKFAVNWSAVPVFNNQIFTRGSSIFIDGIGNSGGLSGEDVRFAYQTALSLWAIALQNRKSQLGPDVQKYVDQSTSSSSKFKLFTPPQVILVDCADNALSIVRWYAEKSSYVAKAQVQGRTVLLNTTDNAFSVQHDAVNPVPAKEINLVTVFVHELGHSFGLPDGRHSPDASVMDPVYVIDNLNKTLSPTDRDTLALVRVLEASIRGASPGVLTAEGCAGLRRDTEK